MSATTLAVKAQSLSSDWSHCPLKTSSPSRISDLAASYLVRESSSSLRRSLRAKNTMASPHRRSPRCLAASRRSSGRLDTSCTCTRVCNEHCHMLKLDDKLHHCVYYWSSGIINCMLFVHFKTEFRSCARGVSGVASFITIVQQLQ